MKGKLKGLAASLALSSIMFLQTLTVYASETKYFDTSDNFTQIFHTRGFMGNAEVLTKLGFVAGIVSAVISICGFIGVSLTVIRVMVSLLYKSHPVLFDEIAEIKQSNTWSGGEGIKGNALGATKFFFGGSINGVKEKSGGGIFDTIIWFVLGAMPNIKHYSDFADGNENAEKLKDLSTTQYILKISPKIIMQIFFFSIAWNGVLFQAYGSVVDAMGVVAQRFVNDDLTVAVENALDTGKKYTFTFKNNGTAFGSFQQKVAEDMYAKACKKMNKSTRTQENYHEVGNAIDKMVATLDTNTVVQVATQRANAVNLQESSESDLLNVDSWTNESTTAPEYDQSKDEVVGTISGTNYTVVKIYDTNGNPVGYRLDGGKTLKYKEIEQVNEISGVQADSDAFNHLAVKSYVTSTKPSEGSANWKVIDGRIMYVTTISDIGGNSKVAWNITSNTTPNLYLVCNIYYTDNTSVGKNYFTKVSSGGAGLGHDEVTKTAGLDDGIDTGEDDLDDIDID